MEEQAQKNESPEGKQTPVQDSIQKLKDKFVPGFKFTLLLSSAFNFAMLVVGCVNVHRCPVNKNIPLFLIAIGAIGLVSKIVSYIRERISRHVQVGYLESALYSVETIFFFLGSYWVYKEYQPSYNSMNPKYCNKTAYLFAFVYLTVYYVIFLCMILGFLCFLICVICLAKKVADVVEDVEAQIDADEAKENLTETEKGETKP